MLVLSRKKQESIVIDGRITIRVVDCGKNGVRLGIAAPGNVKIIRHELLRNHEKGLASQLDSAPKTGRCMRHTPKD